MAKKRSYKPEVEVTNEVISEEVTEEVTEEIIEVVEEEVEVEPKKPIYTVKSAATVVSFRLNVRENPTVDSDVVKILIFKDEVEILDEPTTDGWVSVLCSDGTKGYCLSKFVKTIK